MPFIEDTDFLKMGVYLFTIIFLFILGEEKHPVFYILAGVTTIMFGIELWNLIQSTILTAVIAGVGLMTILFGIVTKPRVEPT